MGSGSLERQSEFHCSAMTDVCISIGIHSFQLLRWQSLRLTSQVSDENFAHPNDEQIRQLPSAMVANRCTGTFIQQRNVPLVPEQVEQQPAKLRKSLKKLAQNASEQNVHQLRTRTRRLEAMLHALAIDTKKNERLLLKTIAPVRKKAGKVRDMDVLTRFASEPGIQNGERHCTVQLLEYLGSRRATQARKLEKLASAQAAEIKKRLNRCERLLRKTFAQGINSREERKWATESAALALQLDAELRDWPKLNRKNLHPFRLKVKELRYVLEMASEGDNDFVDILGEVKDAIGEWHDWGELAAIARKVIQHPGCNLLRGIRSTAEKKFERALALANRMRKENLGTGGKGAASWPARTSEKTQAALVSAAGLAA
jgi:CHAD domain-containing protein